MDRFNLSPLICTQFPFNRTLMTLTAVVIGISIAYFPKQASGINCFSCSYTPINHKYLPSRAVRSITKDCLDPNPMAKNGKKLKSRCNHFHTHCMKSYISGTMYKGGKKKMNVESINRGCSQFYGYDHGYNSNQSQSQGQNQRRGRDQDQLKEDVVIPLSTGTCYKKFLRENDTLPSRSKPDKINRNDELVLIDFIITCHCNSSSYCNDWAGLTIDKYTESRPIL